jgi:S1-C subfamily serine protease
MTTFLRSVSTFTLLIASQIAAGQEMDLPGSQLPKAPSAFGQEGRALPLSGRVDVVSADFHDVELPIAQLAQIAGRKFVSQFESTRSAKDAALYRTISPSVVLVVTKDVLGSGSLISTAGDILTNWHVVKSAKDVGIVFKPSLEGSEPTKDDIKVGRVTRFDPSVDLALVKTTEIPRGRTPIRMGDGSDISVGIDVHAANRGHIRRGS